MSNQDVQITNAAPRRSLFGRLAGAMALGAAGLASAQARAQQAAPSADGPDWPGALKGRHKQLVDAYEYNGGFPLAFAYTFVSPNLTPTITPGVSTAVVILRHGAFPIALNNAMWEKYKVGETMKIIDPETKAPAVKNPLLHPKPGILPVDQMSIDWLLENGTIFGACNAALHVLSKLHAKNAGVTPEEAAKEWAANIVPGMTVIPSGTWGVNRAQEAGCTYCAGG